ncbi:uncharacterized protein LOC119555000 [Drosophila subpulchrella]|uniref:uncharacterized protein LOC119555000 n=1 Tax=Drosophila subpulchrella TaxID=1486046 RepID=UPI0018A15573|nr:uncharacterized protein LOC119555000 [Drosophila subpulchrella]
MSLKYNEALKLLIENLSKNPTPEQQKYMQDATEIAEQLNEGFTNINSIFKGIISNWDETSLFYNNSYPKILSGVLHLKMPFNINPKPLLIPIEQELTVVTLKTTVNHPAVINGYLNGGLLSTLFYSDLFKVITQNTRIQCKSGKSYCLFFCMDSFRTFEIRAWDSAIEKLEFQYRFALELHFPNDSIPYICFDTFFMENNKSDKQKKVRIIHATIHTILIQLNLYSTLSIPVLSKVTDAVDFAEAPNAGETLLKVLLKIIPMLQNREPLKSVYIKLLQFKKSDSVEMSELMELLNLR